MCRLTMQTLNHLADVLDGFDLRTFISFANLPVWKSDENSPRWKSRKWANVICQHWTDWADCSEGLMKGFFEKPCQQVNGGETCWLPPPLSFSPPAFCFPIIPLLSHFLSLFLWAEKKACLCLDSQSYYRLHWWSEAFVYVWQSQTIIKVLIYSTYSVTVLTN